MTEEKIKLIEILMITATLVGPAFAVWLTRMIDNRGAKRERKDWIFRALAKDRFHCSSNDFVAAINLVEIEFYGEEKVINAWNKLRDAHCANGGGEAIRRRTNELLIEIGKVLKYRDLNFTDPGYLPQLHVDIFERNAARDELLIKLLKGESALSIKPSPIDGFNNTNSNKN